MPHIKINEDLCKSCELCVEVCPFSLIEISDKISSRGYYVAKLNDSEEKCTACKRCATICPEVAIEVYK